MRSRLFQIPLPWRALERTGVDVRVVRVEESGVVSLDSIRKVIDASHYEGGSANHVGLIGLGESLQVLLDHGCNRVDNPIATAVLENAASIEDGLRSAGAKVFRARSLKSDCELRGILTFELPGRDPNELRRQMLQEEIVLSVRHGRLRVATHAYNNQEDIDRLVATVRKNNTKTREFFI